MENSSIILLKRVLGFYFKFIVVVGHMINDNNNNVNSNNNKNYGC